MVFDAISSNIDEVLLINPSINVFVFGDFNIHHKDWLTHSGGIDRLLNTVVIFISQMPSNHCQRVIEAAKLAYDNKKLGFQDFWSIANSVQNKGKYAIPPLFNSVEPLSSATDKAKLFAKNFSKNCNLEYPGIPLLVFPFASNYCKRLLKALKLVYANKTKESIISQKLGFWDFWQIPGSVLNKGKSAVAPLFNSLEVLCAASDKAKLFAKTFSKNCNLEGLGIPAFPLRTNLKLYNISVTSKIVKKVFMALIVLQ